MSGRVTDPRPASTLREHELLARLGLGPGASNDEVEAAHDEILDFLGRAPSSLRGWARVQTTEADEAYARLNGAPASASAMEPLVAGPIAAATPRDGVDDDFEDFGDEPDGPVVVTRRERRAAQAQAARAQASRMRPRASSGAVVIPGGTVRKAGIGVVVVALAAAVVFGVYGFGPGGSVPGLTGTPVPQASAGLDTAQVASLMEKIAANPNDTVSLMALANLYYGVGDYATAETWLQKVLGVDPKNVDALLALGAAQFNTGDDTNAEAAWRKVLDIDPKNVEAHYDLGFMYFSQNPPNVAKVQQEWGQVIALAPDSDIAQTVATHLASLTGSPLPSAGASGAPAASPAASPAGSAAPAQSSGPATSPVPSPAAS